MKTGIATRRVRLFAGLVIAAVPSAAVGVLAVLTGPPATGASDPCAASEVARTIGSVAKSMGDYLDSHPETNQAMTGMLQQQAGPQSLTSQAMGLMQQAQGALPLAGMPGTPPAAGGALPGKTVG